MTVELARYARLVVASRMRVLQAEVANLRVHVEGFVEGTPQPEDGTIAYLRKLEASLEGRAKALEQEAG